MTLTDSVLQLTGHPLLLRLVLVALAIALFLVLNTIAKGLFESRRRFGNGHASDESVQETRKVVNVAYFW